MLESVQHITVWCWNPLAPSDKMNKERTLPLSAVHCKRASAIDAKTMLLQKLVSAIYHVQHVTIFPTLPIIWVTALALLVIVPHSKSGVVPKSSLSGVG